MYYALRFYVIPYFSFSKLCSFVYVFFISLTTSVDLTKFFFFTGHRRIYVSYRKDSMFLVKISEIN